MMMSGVSENSRTEIEAIVAAEVARQLARERAILRQAGVIVLRIAAGVLTVLFGVLALFG